MVCSADRISNTKALWLQKFGSDLSDEDAREINESLVVFFRLLKKWKKREETKGSVSDTS